MEKQIDICATCVHDEPGYCSVIGTIPHCCFRHWHCEPGKAAKDYVPKQEEGEAKLAQAVTVHKPVAVGWL